MKIEIGEFDKCCICGRILPAEEILVNWGYCNDCLKKSYEEYLKFSGNEVSNYNGKEQTPID